MDKNTSALKTTFYCDLDHPLIHKTAEKIRAGKTHKTAVVNETLHFVRDKIIFGFDFFQRKASGTLRKGYGACWNKSLLLTALLRVNEIPARFGSIPLKRTFIRPAIGGWHRLANNPYYHCLVHAYINRHWTLLDPVLDSKTFSAFFNPLKPAWNIEWNGKDDMRLYTESVVGPARVHEDIDAVLDSKVGNTELPKLLMRMGNWHVNRQMWKKAGIRPVPPVT